MRLFPYNFRPILCLLLSLTALTFALPGRAQVTLDDLRGSYHGLVFDRDSRLVMVDDSTLAGLYADLADAVARESATPEIFRQALSSASVLARTVAPQAGAATPDIGQLDLLLSAALATAGADPAMNPHRRVLNLLRALGGDRFPVLALPSDPEVQAALQSFQARTAFTYRECTADGMPTPPDFPLDIEKGDAHWTAPVLIPSEMSPINNDSVYGVFPPTRVFFHESENPKGLCSLLLRFSSRSKGAAGAAEIALSGVICQSYETKDTCFWENSRILNGKRTPFNLLDIAGDERLREITATWLNSASLGDGINMSDTCDTCHSGQNAFVFYPDILCPDDSEGSCYGKKSDRDLTYPIGYGPPVNVKELEIDEQACTHCHELATDDDKYWPDLCLLIKHVIQKDLMPPEIATTPPYAKTLYWNAPIPPENPFAKAVIQLRAKCPPL